MGAKEEEFAGLERMKLRQEVGRTRKLTQIEGRNALGTRGRLCSSRSQAWGKRLARRRKGKNPALPSNQEL